MQKLSKLGGRSNWQRLLKRINVVLCSIVDQQIVIVIVKQNAKINFILCVLALSRIIQNKVELKSGKSS